MALKVLKDRILSEGRCFEGMGFIIEKEFQHGRELLHSEGIKRIESLAIIESLDNCQVKIKED